MRTIVKLSSQIKAPVEKVFHVFTDLQSAEKNIKGIEKIKILTDGPVGLGTAWEETRTIFGRPAIETLKIVEFHPTQSYSVGATNHGCEYLTEFRFQPQDGGTLIEMDFKVQAISFFAKLMTPLAPLMAGTVRKALLADMIDLKAVCERG